MPSALTTGDLHPSHHSVTIGGSGREKKSPPSYRLSPTPSSSPEPSLKTGVKRFHAKYWLGFRAFFGLGQPGPIFIAAALAAVIGTLIRRNDVDLSNENIQAIQILGNLWLRLLKCVIVPLIVVSMLLSTAKLKQIPGESRRMGIYAISWYVVTTIIATGVGLALCFAMLKPLVRPLDQSQLDTSAFDDMSDKIPQDRTVTDQMQDLVFQMVPSNPVRAMAAPELLAIVLMGAVIGALVPMGPGKELPTVVVLSQELECIVMKIVGFCVYMAPIGVFFLLGAQCIKTDILEMMKSIGIMIAAQVVGCFFHLLVVYPFLYACIARKNPWHVLKKLYPAILTATGVASSVATLPVTFRVAKSLRVRDVVAKFCLPMGMTINMDAGAIGYPLTMVWIALAQGIEIGAAALVMMCVITALSSMGCSPIPSASLALLIMIGETIGVDVAPVFGMIIAVDFILDRIQTGLNVCGDLFGCLVVQELLERRGLDLSDGISDGSSHSGEYNASELETRSLAKRIGSRRHRSEGGKRNRARSSPAQLSLIDSQLH